MGSKSKSSSSQATTTTALATETGLQDVRTGGDLVLTPQTFNINASASKGTSVVNLTATDYGSVAAGIAAATDTAGAAMDLSAAAMKYAGDFALEAGAAALDFVEGANEKTAAMQNNAVAAAENAMETVAGMTRDQDNVTTEKLAGYAAAAVAVAAAAYYFSKGK